MRVLVTGSRSWTDKDLVFEELTYLLEKLHLDGDSEYVFELVHGHCPDGPDAFADEWGRIAKDDGFPVVIERHRADWKGPRKRGAGFARNAEMVNLGADICLAFIHDESEGASHCSRLAREAGIETRIFRSATSMTMSKPVHPNRVQDELKIEDARLIFRNFGGEAKLYNEQGDRNFAVALDEDSALDLKRLGWPVVTRERTNDLDQQENLYHLPVKVNMKGKFPPKLWIVTRSKNRRTLLTDDMLGMLDYAEFDIVDLRIRPYNWGPIQGKYGTKAYIKIGFFVLLEDDLELKYAHIPVDDGPLELESTMEDGEVVSEGEWELEYDKTDQAELPRGSQ